MFVRSIRYLPLAVAILYFSGADQAQAQFGVPFMFGGYGSSIYANERVPFYALTPPVYYKHPVARSYGYSPFAYPLGSPTPNPVSVSPQVVMSPFCGFAAPAPDEGELADRPKPLMIKNPFVIDAATLTAADGPKPAPRN
jgi:hypothetical protein